MNKHNTIEFSEASCPFCNSKQRKSMKTWKYGKSVDVYRYKCSCGKMFNLYKSPRKTWTIPKHA